MQDMPLDTNATNVNDPYSGMPMDYQTPWAFNYNDEQRYASLLKELSPDQYIKKMIHELKGEVWNEQKNEYEKIQDVSPVLNSRGITVFYHLATSAVNEITTFSNYRGDLKLINRIMKKNLKDAVPRFFYYMNEYGISSEDQISVILDKLQGIMLSAYFKALGAGDRKAATSNISETISSIQRAAGSGDYEREQNSSNRGGGIFSMLRRGK